MPGGMEYTQNTALQLLVSLLCVFFWRWRPSSKGRTGHTPPSPRVKPCFVMILDRHPLGSTARDQGVINEQMQMRPIYHYLVVSDSNTFRSRASQQMYTVLHHPAPSSEVMSICRHSTCQCILPPDHNSVKWKCSELIAVHKRYPRTEVDRFAIAREQEVWKRALS